MFITKRKHNKLLEEAKRETKIREEELMHISLSVRELKQVIIDLEQRLRKLEESDNV